MKIFSFIFIVYLLLLSWQPCQDFAPETDMCAFDATQQTFLHETQSDEMPDDCSPFCFCSCCQISTASIRIAFSANGKFSVSMEKSAESFYQSNYSPQYPDSIWQPPKFNFTA